MRIGASLAIIAVGAILRFAVNEQNTHGFDIGTAGVILMIVGAVGLIVTAIWMATRRHTEIVERNEPGVRRTTYVTPNDRVDGPY